MLEPLEARSQVPAHVGPPLLHPPNSCTEELGFSGNEASSGVCPGTQTVCHCTRFVLLGDATSCPVCSGLLLLGSCCPVCGTPGVLNTGTAPQHEQTPAEHGICEVCKDTSVK